VSGRICYAQYKSIAGETFTSWSVFMSVTQLAGNPKSYEVGLLVRDAVSFDQVLREHATRWIQEIKRLM